MTNNIRKIKQDLRAYAKRCKDVHYTESLLITFLVTGMLFTTSNLFSAPTNTSIENQRQTISTSIKTIHQQVKATRKENDKLLKNTNLELIRLMEQGDHVVKSPWSSWQYGINYFNNNWNGTYKGRGDKQEKYPYEGIFQRSLNSFERYTSPESKNYGLLSKSTNPYSALTSNRSGVLGYGIASTTPKQEPLTVMNVDASIRPKDVYRDPVTAPTVNVSAPVLQALNVPNLLPPSLDIPTPDEVPTPNKAPGITVNPTAEFGFTGHSITGGNPWAAPYPAKNQDGGGKTFWSGWDPTANGGSGAPAPGRSAWKLNGGNVEVDNGQRIPNVFYANTTLRPTSGTDEWTVSNANVHVMGDNSWAPKGTSVIHAVWDGKINNVKATLHGYSTFIAAETWHDGKVHIANSTVNITGQYNNVFFGFPSTYYSLGIDNKDYHSYKQRGSYTGELNVNITNKNNYIYSVMGVQGTFGIENSGKYKINSDNNLVYLGMGYSPNWENLKGEGDVVNDSTKMTPFMKLGMTAAGTVSINGSNNAGLFFENLFTNITPNTNYNLPYDSARVANFNIAKWKRSIVGIYQGEIEIGMKVGETSVSKNNVGVFSRSGQREGMNPEEDLGAPNQADRTAGKNFIRTGEVNKNTTSKGQPDYTKDAIHNLEIANTKIYFGKNAIDSIMIAAERGTVIDVGRPDKASKTLGREAYKEVTPGTTIADSAGQVTSSYNDTANQAATGTVIAYSKGLWDNTYTGATTKNKLEGLPSEVNLYKPVIMSGRATLNGTTLNRSVALVASAGGVVNAKSTVTAKGYSSIIALAEGKSTGTKGVKNSTVNITGDITAKDEWAATDAATKPYLYNNIGAYAGANGEVNVAGNADIYGIGAMASGASAKANLNGSANTIRTGKSGALVATNGGVVNFGGGTITHSENFSGDHDSSTPFNADSSSHINFTGATTLNISHGVLIPGTATDYAAATGTTTKYNGMSNVTVNLTGDNVVLASNNGIHKIWDGTTIANLVKSTMKVAAFNDNKHSYKIYYINGQFDIDSNIDVGNASDDFNKVGLSREVVTINAGKTVSSTVGKGLAMGSNDSANADGNNSKTQFINNGTVDIKGGSLSAGTIGLNISYGQIHNKNIVNVENGIGRAIAC